jgi:membrane protein YdbS with pleckstrin-like domain
MDSIFQNEQLPVGALPRAESVAYEPLAPVYLRVDLLGLWLGRLAILFVFLVYTYLTKGFPEWLRWGVAGFWSFLLVLTTVIRYYGFRIKGYAVRQHDIMYRRGLLFRTLTVVPFTRIQHSEVQQGVIERQFGLARLAVYTAGGSQSDLLIPGLKLEQAEQIRQFLSKKLAADEEE